MPVADTGLSLYSLSIVTLIRFLSRMQTCRSEGSATVSFSTRQKVENLVFIHSNPADEHFWSSVNLSFAARREAARREGFHNSIVFPQISSPIGPSPGGVVLTRLRSNRSPFAAPAQASITGQDSFFFFSFFFFHPSHTVLIQRCELLFLPVPGGAASLKCGLFMGSPSMHWEWTGGVLGRWPRPRQ